jgi:hypothetical protein
MGAAQSSAPAAAKKLEKPLMVVTVPGGACDAGEANKLSGVTLKQKRQNTRPLAEYQTALTEGGMAACRQHPGTTSVSVVAVDVDDRSYGSAHFTCPASEEQDQSNKK